MPKKQKTLMVYVIRGYNKKGRVLNTYHIRAYSQKGATDQVKKRNKYVVRTKVLRINTPEGYDKWLREGSSRKPRRKK